MNAHSRFPFLLLPPALGAALLVAACGGGSGDGEGETTTLSGSVVKGPVAGAEVCAYKVSSGAKGERIGCATTNSTGGYSLEIDHEGAVILEATGGRYTDEATGTETALTEPMRVVLQANGGTATGMVTPLTTVAYSIAAAGAGGVSASSYGSAATSVAAQFQLGSASIVTTAPAVTGTTNDYGKALRALSQYIANGGSLASFQAYVDPSAFQSAFAAAYATINGTTISFDFTGAGGSGSSGSSGGGGGGSCGITVTGSGTVTTAGQTIPFNLPATKVCVTGVAADACSSGNNQLQNIAASGASPGANYSISYDYSYAPGDCSGAITTVNYMQ